MDTQKRRKIEKIILDYLIVAAFGALYSLTYVLFVTPNDFAPSGINGIGVMIEHIFPSFSMGYMIIIVNVPLCIFAFFMVDREFTYKTFVFSIVQSLSYFLFNSLNLEGLKYETGGVDTIYPVLLAGLICGFIYGILFKMHGSTAGVDIIAKYISKVKPTWSFFWVNFALNAIVAISSYFVFADYSEYPVDYNIKPVVLSLLHNYISVYMGSWIISGAKQAYKYTIITTHGDEIAKEITTLLQHTSTKLQGVGTYSHLEKDVLICVINKHQANQLQRILEKYDNTFSLVETVNQIHGNFRIVKKGK